MPRPRSATTPRPMPPMVSASRRAGANAASWLCSATSAAPISGEPAVDADHGNARVVLVEAPALRAVESAVDAPPSDTPPRELAAVEPRVHEAMVLADEVGLAGVAEPRASGSTIRSSRSEVEVRRDHPDPLAVAVEQRRGDRDRRLRRSARTVQPAAPRSRSCRAGSTPRVDCWRDSCAGTVEAATRPSRSSTRSSCASAVWATL